MELLDKLEASNDLIQYSPVGSTYILGKGEDIDYLVLVPFLAITPNVFTPFGFKNESYGYADTEFYSFRKDNINLIVTQDPGYYDRFVIAAEVCKLLKVEDKQNRINVHQLILKGKLPEKSKSVSDVSHNYFPINDIRNVQAEEIIGREIRLLADNWVFRVQDEPVAAEMQGGGLAGQTLRGAVAPGQPVIRPYADWQHLPNWVGHPHRRVGGDIDDLGL